MSTEQNQFEKDHPSLQQPRPPLPHGWIQWKGTDVCIDLHCKCGEHFHIDDEFLYHVKCPACDQIYECSGFIELIPLQHVPERMEET